MRWCAVLSLVLLAGCWRPVPPVETRWLVMGTFAAASVPATQRAELPVLESKAADIYNGIETLLSTYREASLLSEVNRLAGSGKSLELPDVVRPLMDQTLRLTRESGGAFSPLVGPLMEAWGFRKDGVPARPPQLAPVMALLNPADIGYEKGRLELKRPGQKLELGAIAKGYAVDLVYTEYRRSGVSNALVNLGGNLRAIGVSGSGPNGWRTGVRNPFNEEETAGSFVLRDGEAVATSGNYERFVEIDGVKYAHIMDARSGLPVRGIAGVTVVAPTGMIADGLSTSLFVLGPEAGVELLKKYPGCAVCWIPDERPMRMIVNRRFLEIFTPSVSVKMSVVGN